MTVVEMLNHAAQEWIAKITDAADRDEAHEALAEFVASLAGWTGGFNREPRDISIGEAQALVRIICDASLAMSEKHRVLMAVHP